jgi:hypothetical protein
MKLTMLALVFMVACGGGTSIEQSWRAPGGHAELHRVATVMLWRDATVRRNTEDELAARLRKSGVDAVPGYTVLTADEGQDPELARRRLQAQGFDGAIIMRVVSRERQVQYVPPTYTGYWGGAWYPVGGSTWTTTIVRVETAAYSLADGQLVYSALSKTTDPSSVPALMSSVTAKIASALQKERVVIAAQPVQQPGA